MEPDVSSGFDWDKHNAGHIAKHQVRPDEVEQVLLNSPIPVNEEIHNGEERFLNIGHTQAGKVLWVCWTLRDGKMRPVTSWVASRDDREDYYAQKGMET